MAIVRCTDPGTEYARTVATPDLHTIHLKNTHALERAFETVARDCRHAIAREDSAEATALTNTCIFLFGARMENRLFRLLHEPGAFSDVQRKRIAATGSVENMWLATVSEAFAARRSLTPAQVPGRLTFTDAARYNELVRLINDELAPIIQLRNILGHGQWDYALTSDRSAFDQARTTLLRRTRLWHLRIKANLLDHLVGLLHDLAVTKTAFERDFDRHWANLTSARHRLDLDSHRAWESQLISNYQRRPSAQGNFAETP